MLFQKRTNITTSKTGLALGSTTNFELTREFMLEGLMVRVDFNLATVAATMGPDGLHNIVKRIQLKTADGSQNRIVVDVSGPGLLEYNRQVNSGTTLDYWKYRITGATVATGNYTLYFPIHFAHPQIADPLGSAFLLPANRFNNNPEVIVTLASQSEIDINGTPTFALNASNATVSIVEWRRRVDIPDFATLNWELAESEVPYASAGRAEYELPVPGAYTGLLLRSYTSASARGDLTLSTGTFPQQSLGEFRIESLGQVIRRFRLPDLQAENQLSNADLEWAAVEGINGFYLDFLTDRFGGQVRELGSVLETNLLAGTGSRFRLIGDINGGTGVKMKYLHHRIFGNIADFKMKLAA